MTGVSGQFMGKVLFITGYVHLQRWALGVVVQVCAPALGMWGSGFKAILGTVTVIGQLGFHETLSQKY